MIRVIRIEKYYGMDVAVFLFGDRLFTAVRRGTQWVFRQRDDLLIRDARSIDATLSAAYRQSRRGQ